MPPQDELVRKGHACLEPDAVLYHVVHTSNLHSKPAKADD